MFCERGLPDEHDPSRSLETDVGTQSNDPGDKLVEHVEDSLH